MNGTTALRMFFGVAKNQKHQRIVHYHNGDILTEALLRMTPAMALGITDTMWEIEALMAH